ncbi:ABC transporter ATP-binding protein [Candidatus Bathyarchaeota archaeon]|nr:ABC transporter ATP-binding protein [Candidatus Bathyarchaeota archaeon]
MFKLWKRDEESREAISPLKFIIKHLGGYKKRILASFILTTLFFLIPMQEPILMGAIVDALQGKTVVIYSIFHLPENRRLALQILGATFTVLAGLLGLIAYLRSIAIARVGRHFNRELQRKLVQKIESLSLDIHSKYGPGELLNRVILDTQTLRPFVDSVIVKNSSNVIRLAFPVMMVFILSPFLGLLMSPLVVIQWIVTRKLRARLHKASRRARTSIAQLTTIVKEHIDGIETIKTSNAEQYSFDKVSRQSRIVEHNQVETRRYAGMLLGTVSFITYLGVALVFWIGGMYVLQGTLSTGTLVAFALLWLTIYQPLRNFYTQMNQYQNGIVAAERIQEILDLPPTVQDAPDAVPLKAPYGRVELRDVYFTYPLSEEPVLKGIRLDIEPGTLVGIVGKSGAGKSTILKLITRMYDPTEGQVYVDEQDIRTVTLDSLRSQIAVVPQMPLIFSGSVSENIRLAKPDATDEEIREACRAADALDFIERLEKGFETHLGQGGVSLSGGQIQRISIARALIRKPRILLLDEPASSLDGQSEEAIMQTLRRLRDITVIIVGHHLRAIRMADRLIVMDRGRIVEDGVHDDLVTSGGVYNTLYVKASA